MFKKISFSLLLCTLVFAVGFATTAFADTTPTQIACVGTAVSTREQAIDSAMQTYTSTLNNAYTARASALQAAYQQTDETAVKADVKAAWNGFKEAKKYAYKTWRSARNDAWASFAKNVSTCKANSITDTNNLLLETSGN